jgi:hypothetical protein
MPFSNDYVINISDTANGGIGGAGFTLQSGSSGNAGWWTWRHGNSDARRFMQWSGATAAEGPGQIRFPNGFSFGDAFTNSSRLVVGPTSSVNTDLCAFSGTGGTTLTDSGIPSANVVLVSRNIIAGTGLTGGGALTSDVTLSASLSGPTSSTSGDLVAFSGTGGTRLSDSGIPGTAIVVRGSSPFTTSFGIGISAPTGINNTMIGYHAANLLTAGAENTMLGYLAGSVQTTSDRNTLLGSNAGELTTTGAENTCVGWRACDGATTMTNGTFIGSRAGLNLTMTGDSNVAVGHGAMASGDGNNNTAIGTSALFSITGGGNTAVGLAAGAAISVGTLNTAVGQQALGVGGPLSGSLNLALGYGAGASLTTSDHDNICISNAGVSGDAGVIRIGTIGTHTTVAIVANAVGANPATGITGHNVRSCVTAPSGLTLSNNTPTNIASLTLGAGNWEISAVGGLDGSLTGTDFLVGISGTSGSFSGTSKGLTQVESPTVSSATADITLTIPGVQFLPTTSTTYYLVEQTTIAAGTALGYGCISAWSR